MVGGKDIRIRQCKPGLIPDAGAAQNLRGGVEIVMIDDQRGGAVGIFRGADGKAVHRLQRGPVAKREGRIPGRVSHVEKLGGETLVYVHAEDHGLLTVRLFGEQDFAVDEAVALRLDPDRLFHFDAEGQRLR